MLEYDEDDLMKKRVKEPSEPVERYNTIRRYIISLLEENPATAKGISSFVRIAERDVYDHLKHIHKTLHKNNQRLLVAPAACEKCGFEFKKRDRLTKPSKCPVCHSSLIRPPLYSIESQGQ